MRQTTRDSTLIVRGRPNKMLSKETLCDVTSVVRKELSCTSMPFYIILNFVWTMLKNYTRLRLDNFGIALLSEVVRKQNVTIIFKY